MMAKDVKQDYQALSSELESIVLNLQQDSLDIDEAVKRYERGLELVAVLEAYLKTAENKVTKLKAQFPAPKDKAA
jgi:exodeoxyribonuclease VII small subunit